jgi:hypothetical protein
MATNNRPLKAYVRYDGSGRAVSSSLIWRKNKPKVGNWKQIQGYECCDDPVCPPSDCQLPDVEMSTDISEVITGGGEGAIGFSFACDFEDVGLFFYISVPIDPLTPEQIVTQINQRWGWLGTWSSEGTVIKVVMSGCLENSICPNNNLSLGIYNYNPCIP